jgi:nitrite reductase/ring-hydroxylating ferredoxin subunit
MRSPNAGNERLQDMMGIMATERGGQVFATDERCSHVQFLVNLLNSFLFLGSALTTVL